MPRLPQLGDLLQRMARGGLRPPVEPFPSQDMVRGLVESRVGPQRMPMAPIPPEPMMTPPPTGMPQIPSQAIPNVLRGPEPVMGPEVGSIVNPERGLPTPPANITGGRGKAEAPSKAQLKALVERLLGREVAPNERLGGLEREKAMKEVISQGVPEVTEPYSNLMDMGRTQVAGLPTSGVPGGRALRLPLEEARILALQQPDRFQPGGFRNYGAPPIKEAFETMPGSPEDIIGGIGLKGKKFEPVLTAAMKQADKYLNAGEIEKAGYALPKPANLRVATAQAFKVYNNLLNRGTLSGQWKSIYEKALDSKPQTVAGMDKKDYFIEAFQKYSMNKNKFSGRFKEEFKFINSLGKQLEALIAPEKELLEKLKTKLPVPEEGPKTSFQQEPVEMVGKMLEGPGIGGAANPKDLEKSYKNSKTFKKFLDAQIREASKAKRPLSVEEIKIKWAEHLDKFRKEVKETGPAFPPLIIGGK